MAILRSPEHVIYTGEDRREVQVLVDGQWHAGELRSWDQAEDGTWSGIVTWSSAPAENRLDRFPVDQIRSTAAEESVPSGT